MRPLKEKEIENLLRTWVILENRDCSDSDEYRIDEYDNPDDEYNELDFDHHNQ